VAGQARDPGRGDEVRIPRWLLALLIGVSALAIVGLAFVVGYQAARRSPSPAAGPAPGTSAPAGPPASGPAYSGSGSGPATGSSAGGVVAAPTPAPGAPLGDAPSQSSPSAAQVSAYFAQTDVIQSAFKEEGDPASFAQRLLMAAANGDTSGLDELVAKQGRLAESLRAIQPPAPCAEHLRRSIDLIERSGRLLKGMRDGIASGDLASLAGMETAARQLEADARAVDALAEDVKKRHGTASDSEKSR
jgi:hypothetical protein